MQFATVRCSHFAWSWRGHGLSSKVAATHWIPLRDLFDSAHAAAVTMEHAGQTLRFPAIEIRGLTIWGLTLRMLRNFESLVGRP